MQRGCFIGIDQGSSSTKAVVVTTDGQVLWKTKSALPKPHLDGLRVEHDPGDILKSVEAVLTDAGQTARASDLPVLGIGLSCQRSSCLVWDENSIEPLSSVISWRDRRGIELVESLFAEQEIIGKATGLPLTPYYSASKLRWLRDNLTDARSRTAVFGTLSSFISQRLTAGRKAMIDHSNACRTQLMNLSTLSWDEKLLSLFGLSGIKLPDIRPTAYEFGHIPMQEGDAPLLAVIGDQQAAIIGQGVLEKGDGGINYGTGGFLMVNTGEELKRVKGLMASVHFSTETAVYYLLEGSVNAAGDALEWLRLRFGLFREYSEVDDLCWRASSDAVVFIGLNGTGAPHWETGISSAIHGLKVDSSPADIVRGTVEGIAFFMKDIAEEIKSAGVEPNAFVASGGLASLSYLVQFQADLLGKDIVLSTEQDVSALGAALLAGMKYGVWSMQDIKRLIGRGEEIRSEKNPGAEHRYRRWKELHRMVRELDKI